MVTHPRIDRTTPLSGSGSVAEEKLQCEVCAKSLAAINSCGLPGGERKDCSSCALVRESVNHACSAVNQPKSDSLVSRRLLLCHFATMCKIRGAHSVISSDVTSWQVLK